MIKSPSCVSGPLDAVVTVPGSKSITNRVLMMAALAHGQSTLTGVLQSDDTKVAMEALRRLGVEVALLDDTTVSMVGCGGRFPVTQAEVYTHESGTSTRFLLPMVAAAADGKFRFHASRRMMERPLESLCQALSDQGVVFNYEKLAGLMPLNFTTSGLRGGDVMVDVGQSSQFYSGLMMAAPFAKQPMVVSANAPIDGKPYVTMTQRLMAEFGIESTMRDSSSIAISQGAYAAQDYAIEPDMSTASYFFAAPAICGGQVTVRHCNRSNMLQGDVKFLTVLEKMGAQVHESSLGITVRSSGELQGVEVDMAGFSDTFMTVCAVAAFTKSSTTLHSLAHTRLQESDRVSAIAEGLMRLGCGVETTDDSITIHPAALSGARVSGYNDHRIAMSLALVGLKVPGVQIEGAECVAKTCPDYFERLGQLH